MSQAATENGTLAAKGPDDMLPEHWPAVTPAPARAFWLPWPIAVLIVPFYWLLPRRLGPHYGRVSWFGILSAHLLWTVYGLGYLLISLNEDLFMAVAFVQTYPQPDIAYLTGGDWMHWLSVPLYAVGAAIVSICDTPESLLLLAMGVVGFELFCGLMGILMMAYGVGGERNRRLLARCVKLALLATTTLFPVGLLLVLAAIQERNLQDEDYLLISCIGGLFFLWVLFRSVSRYAGKPEGPAWTPVRAVCSRCGYQLTRLTVERNCPECGLAIRQSLPESRHPTAWAAAGRLQKPAAYLRTLGSILRSGRLFMTVPVRAEYGPARRFALLTAALAILLWAVLEWGANALILQNPHPMININNQEDALGYLLGGLIIWLGLQWLNSLFTFIGARYGRDDLRPIATLVFYQTAWLLPLAVSLVISHLLLEWLVPGMTYRRIDLWMILRYFISQTPPLAVLLLWIWRILAASRYSRYCPV